MNALRLLINDLALPRLQRLFKDRAKLLCGAKYPRCETLAQWLDEYKHGPYDNQKHWMVYTLCNEIWKGDATRPTVEKMTMSKLGLEYLNLIIDKYGNLVKPKTNRPCGSIRKALKRLTQTVFVDPFR